MFSIGTYVIQGIKKRLFYFFDFIDFAMHILEQIFFRYKDRKIIKPIIYKQILFTGVDALNLVGIIALVLGGIIVVIMESLGQTIFIDRGLLGSLFSQLMLRELAPLITAIILIGRSATAIATEIGNMRVNNEIEALETMGVDPFHFLVIPRIVGMTVSLVFLVLYFFFIGLVGGFLVSHMTLGVRTPFDEYLAIVFQKMEFIDIGIAILKSIFFGFFIAAIACYKGMNIPKSINFVPVTASQTVVSSMSTVFFLYAYITALFYI